MFRTGYFAGSSHCAWDMNIFLSTFPAPLYTITAIAYVSLRSFYALKYVSLASCVLLHNSHNHHAAYCIANYKANMTSLKYQLVSGIY